ncbi:hypothetical protein Cs7R123_49250 [Catellatospora sp. TT07R-123]|uniref:hypothetical protein n=1 Tax=Catellatospora sp. TT07R-123 TaxID=2733863 RepID=UPI001B1F977E|nr:hypothetical protein [Catellatospora sp. TT07R-123]GHJ47583.1 hypothetical protein Cs7R123_49250 [Catellatospora sp. TT07R-123]
MRPDLLALSADALAALTNRGLVKRAAKDLDTAAPEVREEADGTVRGRFADGTAAELPPGGLDGGRCTCGAAGTCRHLVGLVLAYQLTAATGTADAPAGPAPEAFAAWSPGQITDEQLAARVGPRQLAAARRAHHAGYTARIRRATAADPVPQVELPTATVRFLVPADLGFVHTDAAAGSRDDIIALAVWAFRAADTEHPDLTEVRLDVGGRVTDGTGSGLERALVTAAAVLQAGAVNLGSGLDAALADERRRLDEAGLRWPLLALDEVAEQLTAYRDRSARYQPEQLAACLAELHARHRAAARPDAVLRSSILGTAEAAETPLRRARLDSLGCRVRAVGEQRVAEVYLAHADTATVLVLRRQWDGDDDGPALARKRVDRTSLGALAAGNLVTESAVRSASRAVRLAAARVAKTTVSPSRGGWDELPSALVAADYAALAAELDQLPPRPIRPRIEAELVRVLAVAEVASVRYAPGDQRLDAQLTDCSGNTATVTATHSAAAPGRLDSLAAALTGQYGPVRHISGVVRRSAGTILLEPIGVAAADQLIVPDLLPPQAAANVELATDGPGELLADALGRARTLLAEAPHRGLRHLPPSYRIRLEETARALSALGLHRTAEALTAFSTAPGDDEEASQRSWVDAYLRTELALDLY